jgi:hypothetical protein
MKTLRYVILPIIAAATWISLNEFVRNQFLLFSFWTDHFQALGISFPSEPVNGAVWGLWSLLFAVAIFLLAKQNTLQQTTVIAWLMAFILMWVSTGNMGFLPWGILPIAVPWSVVETFGAAYITKKLGSPST